MSLGVGRTMFESRPTHRPEGWRDVCFVVVIRIHEVPCIVLGELVYSLLSCTLYWPLLKVSTNSNNSSLGVGSYTTNATRMYAGLQTRRVLYRQRERETATTSLSLRCAESFCWVFDAVYAMKLLFLWVWFLTVFYCLILCTICASIFTITISLHHYYFYSD